MVKGLGFHLQGVGFKIEGVKGGFKGLGLRFKAWGFKRMWEHTGIDRGIWGVETKLKLLDCFGCRLQGADRGVGE